MAAISPERVVTLANYTNTSAFDTVATSPVATIWPREGGSAAEAQSIADALNRAPHLTAYARGGSPGIPERLHYSASERVAPVVAIADEGWSIRVDGSTPLDAGAFCCGAHGYDNALPSMRPIFLARGPAFRRGIAPPGPFDNVHVQPLLAHILRLDPALLPPVNGSLAEVWALLQDSVPTPPPLAPPTPPTPAPTMPAPTGGGAGGASGADGDDGGGVSGWLVLSVFLTAYGVCMTGYAQRLRAQRGGTGAAAGGPAHACEAAANRCPTALCGGAGATRSMRVASDDSAHAQLSATRGSGGVHRAAPQFVEEDAEICVTQAAVVTRTVQGSVTLL